MRRMICLLAICFIFMGSLTPVYAESLNLTPGAASSILIDAQTQTILYKNNETEKLYPASTTKIMTMILLFEAINKNSLKWDDMLTCSQYASSMGGSQVYLEPSETMSVKDLFKAIAIASANDACVMVGERIAGTNERFVEMMNEKAKALNLKNTHFANCTGLHDDNHYTCAYDLAIMASYLIEIGNDELFAVTSLYDSYIREDTAKKFWLVNTNKLLKQYSGVDGLKTGYTSQAGYCIVTTCKKDGLRLIGVVLKEEKPTIRNQEMMTLLDYGFSLYQSKTLFKKEEVIDTIKIKRAKVKEISLISLQEINYIINKNEEREVTYKINVSPYALPLKAHDEIAQIDLYLGDECIASYPLYTKDDVEPLSLIELTYLNLMECI